MNKKKNMNMKRMYVYPSIKSVSINLESLMVTGSGDHSPIGQGGLHGDAKRGWFSESTEESTKSDDKSFWED